MQQVAYLKPSGELKINSEAGNISATWVLNDIGTATLTIPISGTNTVEFLDVGTYIFIFDDPLPTWAGVILEVNYSPDQTATVNLKSLEWLTTGLLTPQGFTADGKCGDVAKALLWESGQKQKVTPLHGSPTNLTAGAYTWAIYDYTPVFEVLKSWSDNKKADWWINDDFELNVVDYRGRDAGITLFEDSNNFSINGWTEDRSNLTTSIIGLGQGNDIVSKPKKLMYIPSYAPWRMQSIDYSNIAIVPGDEVKMIAPIKSDLNSFSRPVFRFDVSVHRGILVQLWVGDTFRIVTLAGQEHYVRLLGVEINATDVCRMVLETVTPYAESPIYEWRY